MITFSIVTITYNAASVLAPTLDSVLMQNYPHVDISSLMGRQQTTLLPLLRLISSVLMRLRMSISYAYKANLTMDSTTL